MRMDPKPRERPHHIMKFIVSWKIPTAHHKAAGERFLTSGAPAPAGLTILGRWHAPGSACGWLLVETQDPKALYEHVAEWASLLELEATPVIEDAEAAEALAKVYGN